MAIDTKSRDHIANNSFVVSAPSEQQSVSSDISNPRQEKKDQQLSDAMSPPPNLIMDDEQPVLSIASPQLSPVALEPETTNTIKIATTPPPPQMQQPQKSQSLSPPTTTSARGRDGSLPQMIDGYYPPHPQQPPTKHNPQNTNDSRKLFVGGLPKDGMCRRILEPIEQNLRSLCCFYSHVVYFSFSVFIIVVTAEEFYLYFAQYGEIIDSFIVYDRETGKPRGFGFVTFVDPAVCRRLLLIYEKENTSISEDEVVGWNEDTETMDGSVSMSRPPSVRLQMRGRFIELKIAQPRGESQNNSKLPLQQHQPISTRPARPRYQQNHHYHQPQAQYPSVVPRYYPHYTNSTNSTNLNDCSSYDGEYDEMNKISATLSQQQQHQHHHHHPYQYHPPPTPQPQHRPSGYGYMNSPVPMTPGGPMVHGGNGRQLHQRYNHPAPLMTPATPAQTALDIAHHMIFYAQLLATPSMVSNTNYDDMHYYQEQILRTADSESVAGNGVNNTYYTPSQPPPRPCTPSLSVPEVLVSPSKKRSAGVGDVFKIGGGTFYPDTSLSSSPTTSSSPSKVISKDSSSLLSPQVSSIET